MSEVDYLEAEELTGESIPDTQLDYTQLDAWKRVVEDKAASSSPRACLEAVQEVEASSRATDLAEAAAEVEAHSIRGDQLLLRWEAVAAGCTIERDHGVGPAGKVCAWLLQVRGALHKLHGPVFREGSFAVAAASLHQRGCGLESVSWKGRTNVRQTGEGRVSQCPARV